MQKRNTGNRRVIYSFPLVATQHNFKKIQIVVFPLHNVLTYDHNDPPI